MTQPMPNAPSAPERLCIYIPSYNARPFLPRTVTRIPWEQLPPGITTEVLFVDNASRDGTQDAIEEARRSLASRSVASHAIFHASNRGYGGSVKSAIGFALERGFDYLAVLHADGQYAPEELPRLLTALLSRPEVCLLFGSRLAGEPLQGGMPFYKYVANHVLSGLQNLCSGLKLSEYHSGYRLYRLSLLSRLPWRLLSDGFVIDNEIIFMIHSRGFGIAELPIPTFYGEEKSHVPRIGTPLAILKNLSQYVLARTGLRRDPRYTGGEPVSE